MWDVLFLRREFLNLPGSHGKSSVQAGVTLDDEYSVYVDGEVAISDCSKTVHLDISIDTEVARENSIHKLRTLATVLSEMAEWVEANGEQVAADLKKRQQERLAEREK